MGKKFLLGLSIAILPMITCTQIVEATPSTPTNVNANSPDGTATATVTWSHASGAVRYRAKAFIGLVAVKTSKVLTGDTRSFTFNGLEYDIPYILKVEAGDASTWSAPTAASAVIPQAASPSAPSQPDLSVIADQELKATWSEPSSDGGSVITKYQVQLMKGKEMVGSPVVTAARNISLTTDDKTSSYTVTVAATNAAGKTSSISEPSTSVIPTFEVAQRLAPRTSQTPNTPNTPSTSESSGSTNGPNSNNSIQEPAKSPPSASINPNTSKVATYTKTVTLNSKTSSKTLLTLSRLKVPKGAKTSFKISTASQKYCTLTGTSVKSIKAGTCSVTVTVTTKAGKKTAKTVKLIAVKKR